MLHKLSEYVKCDGWLETSERVCDWLVCMVCSDDGWLDWIERDERCVIVRSVLG